MARGNGKGPMEMGPRTGRGMGYCTGHVKPGYQTPRGYGQGCGHGHGQGYGHIQGHGCGYGHHSGHRHMFYATGQPRWARGTAPADEDGQSAFDEKLFLKNQVAVLREQLDEVNGRLLRLENENHAQ